MASTAANLVWNLDPRDESTVSQLPPPPTHTTSPKPLQRPLTLRVSCWKKFNSIAKHPLSLLLTPTQFLTSHLYASTQARQVCRKTPKYFSNNFKACQIVKLWNKNRHQLLPYFPSPKASSRISSSVKRHIDFHSLNLFGFFV